MACRYTYKGKVYSEEEFKALLASGELAKQHKEGKVKVQLPSSQMERMMARAEKLASAEGFKAGVEATKSFCLLRSDIDWGSLFVFGLVVRYDSLFHFDW